MRYKVYNVLIFQLNGLNCVPANSWFVIEMKANWTNFCINSVEESNLGTQKFVP